MKPWTVNILLVVGGILVGILIAEAALRIMGVTYPSFFLYHPYLGASLRPGASGSWLKEGGGYVSINSDGLRDVEHAIAKPPNTLRIAVLGDSYTQAFEVNREEAFWAVMEKELQDCVNLKGRKVEVINFGKSGLGTSEELLVLRRQVWKYSPDIVLLAVCTGNDISDNSPILKQHAYIPYFIYKGDELVLVDEHTRKNYQQYGRLLRIAGGIINRSRVLQVIFKAGTEWYAWNPDGEQVNPGADNGRGSVRAPAGREGNGAATSPLSQYREPDDPIWKEAWRVTEGVLLKMRDEVHAGNARFLVVILSNPAQVHPDPSVRRRAEKRYGVKDLFYPDRRIRKLCEQDGIPVLPLAPRFREHTGKTKVRLHGFEAGTVSGHWNRNGHRLAGETISEWLCAELAGTR